MTSTHGWVASSIIAVAIAVNVSAADQEYVFESGHKSLQKWLMPFPAPAPQDNIPNEARIALGKALYFDPRLSGDGNMSCATCHNPALGMQDDSGHSTQKDPE